MIKIHQPQLIQGNEFAKLQALIDIDGVLNNLWIKVDTKYGKYLCWERSDAFIVGLLSYAMRNGHDITCEAPVGEYLYYQIGNYLIDAVCKGSGVLYKTKVIAPVDSSNLENAGAVGTGISCGIDSFHALSCHSDSKYKKHNITHLAFNNVGSHGIGPEARKLYGERKEIAEDFCREYNYELVESDSNIMDLDLTEFVLVHTYLNAFISLSLQKLYSIYYYASGYSFMEFSLKQNDKHDCAFYDLLSLDMFSTPSLRFYSEGATLSRFEKTKEVANYPPSYRYLSVCFTDAKNCGYCEKCKRTILTLDALNKLELYKDVFDVNYYRLHQREYLVMLYQQWKAGNSYYAELYPFFKKKITFSICVYSHLNSLVGNIKKYLSARVKNEYLRTGLKNIYILIRDKI